MKSLPMLLVASAAALLMASTAGAENIQRTLKTTSAPEINIINAVGDINVRGVSDDEIRIDAELGDSAERLEVSERGERVTIEVIYTKRNWRDDGTRLTVDVPQASSVEIEATSADIDIAGVRGRLNLSSVSGDVDAEVFTGDLEARSTSGDVTVRGHGDPGDASIESTSGDVVASGLAGSLRARSTSGDVEVSDSQLQRLRLGVVSGDIEVTAATTAQADVNAEAVSGDIDVELPREFAGRVDVTTLNGEIDNCFGPQPQRTSRYGPGRVLTFDQGAGDGRVDIETVNGDIDICKR